MNKLKGLVFNIQRYSLNDGSGIRTIVFFKGCALKCPWCSNPESQSNKIEFMKNRQNPLKLKEVGKWYTVDELTKEVLKDEIFFETSGGGVTLSGGEVLMQGEFATKLLQNLKEHDINTAIETCGFGNINLLKKMLPYIDTVLFDLKIVNEKRSIGIIKGSFKTILNNFLEAIKNNNVIVRFPYIPGYTDDKENIDDILKILKDNNLKQIHVLPYHNYGASKYELLDRDYELKNTIIPSKTQMDKIKEYISKQGFEVLIGG